MQMAWLSNAASACPRRTVLLSAPRRKLVAQWVAFLFDRKEWPPRSLTSAEIYEQVMHVRDDFNTRVTSVVLMGQRRAVRELRCLDWCPAPSQFRGWRVSARAISPSRLQASFLASCGLQKARAVYSRRLTSLCGSRTRDALMPGVKRYSLLRLYDAMGDYVEDGRRPTYSTLSSPGQRLRR